MKAILTKQEILTLRSMARYWNEVREREDQEPLFHEVQQVYQMLGTRLLFIVSDYVDGIGEK